VQVAFLSPHLTPEQVGLGGLVLAIGAKVRWFKSGQGRLKFKGDKNPKDDFLQRGSKAVDIVS
jgi:hypothetical protein